jgi:hypothetical protein
VHAPAGQSEYGNRNGRGVPCDEPHEQAVLLQDLDGFRDRGRCTGSLAGR